MIDNSEMDKLNDYLQGLYDQACKESYFKGNKDKLNKFKRFFKKYAIKESKEEYIKYFEKENLKLKSLVGGTSIAHYYYSHN